VFAVGFKIGLILFLGFGVFIIVARLR